MVGIQGLGGVPEPKSDRTSKVRSERDDVAKSATTSDSGTQATDNVSISSAAQAAAEVARVVQLANAQSEIRMERVEEAKANIERGDYRDPEVVRQVAQRLIRFLE